VTAKARRRLDPVTRDYVVEAGGVASDVGINTQILIALGMKRGSCIVYPTLGSRLHTIGRADSAGLRLAEFYAREALENIRARVKDLSVAATLSRRKSNAIDLAIDYRLGNETQRVVYTAAAG
jgi:phage gp46-like protein